MLTFLRVERADTTELARLEAMPCGDAVISWLLPVPPREAARSRGDLRVEGHCTGEHQYPRFPTEGPAPDSQELDGDAVESARDSS